MPYLPAKVELVSWTTFLPKGFENGIIQEFSTSDYMLEGSISCFACFLVKENSLETDCDFRKCLTKGFFFYWIWRISKFQFWRRILYFYRQPLLIFRALGCWVAPVEYCSFCTAYSQVAADVFSSRHCPTWLRLLLFSSFSSLNSFSKLLIFYLESLQFQCQHVL